MASVGFAGMQKAAAAAAQGGGGYSGRLGYAKWESGQTLILRFLSDDPLTVDFYEFVADNQGKTQNFIVAPDLHADDPDWKGEDWVLKYGGMSKEYGTQNLSTPTPKTRTVAVAVLREEVAREVDGKTVIEYQDVLREIEVKGEKYPAREFLLVKQAYKNFWSPIIGYYHEYGTICDRDYKITRQGGDKETTYHIIPKREDADFDLTALQTRYGYGTGQDADGKALTPESPDRFLYCPQTLMEWAEYYSGEDRVKFFLGDAKAEAAPAHASTPARPSSAGSDEAQAAPPPSATDFSSLRARLEAHK